MHKVLNSESNTLYKNVYIFVLPCLDIAGVESILALTSWKKTLGLQEPADFHAPQVGPHPLVTTARSRE